MDGIVGTHRRALGTIGLFPVLLALFFLGCGYPEVQPENLKLLTSLRTAISAQNTEWLQMNEDAVSQRFHEGKMSDGEHKTFLQIIERARGGDWSGAENAIRKFQRAQRPTDGQILRNREHRGES